jgi:DNA replication protein DnaC
VTGPLTEAAADAAIGAATRSLALPTVRAEAGPLADAAARDQLTHRGFLAEVLSVEVDARDTRRRQRRRKQARFPRIKTLEAFDTSAAAASIEPAVIATLAAGSWIDRGEPVVLLGDSGTGKSHLLIGLGMAACDQGRSVRYVTAAALTNELVEAADERALSRAVARYARLDLLCVDELGCAPRGAE